MAWWLTPQTPDPEVGRSSTNRVAVLCPWARHIYPPKVLVIPRKRWLRPNINEKLFTGTLNIKQTNLVSQNLGTLRYFISETSSADVALFEHHFCMSYIFA